MVAEKDEKLCGVGIFTLPDLHPFTPACEVHDDSYTILAPDAQELQRRVDFNFWLKMIEINNKSVWWKRTYLLPTALLFRGIVSIAGGRLWRAHKRPPTI